MQTTSASESLTLGIVISSLFGLACGGVTYAATAWMWEPLGWAASIAVGGLVMKTLLSEGYSHITIPAYHVGVAVRLGDEPTGKIYGAGDHWGFPGIAGAIPVDVRRRRIDLTDEFSATAADTTDVGVDGFVFVRTCDATKTIGVKDLEQSVRELLEARIRLFTSIVAKAENAVQFRDLLADYLELESSENATTNSPAAYEAVRNQLQALENSPEHHVVNGGTDALMATHTAGAFKRALGEWGYQVDEVEIEQFDIPDQIKEAKMQAATQESLMNAQKTRNTARKEMIAELVAVGVNPNNAANSVDLLLNLAVKKEVQEITITDIDKVADKLGEPIAAVLAEWLAHRSKTK